MTNCGLNSESCCTSLLVAGGTYYRTYDPTDSDDEVELAPDGGPTGEADPATVSSFLLDKYDVTVGRFRQFVNAVQPPDGGAGWLPPAGSGKHAHLNGGNGLNATGGGYEPGWLASDNANVAPSDANLESCTPPTWTPTPGTLEDNQETLPITCVDWAEAYAFCIWDGGFLASEAEWEYAAAGGSQQREYPWGSTDPGVTNQYAIYNCYYPLGTTSCMDLVNVAPVGMAPLGAGLWGHLDLVGDVVQWVADWHAAYVDPCTDCANFTAAWGRGLRNADDYDPELYLQSTHRGYNPPTGRYNSYGVRCARMP